MSERGLLRERAGRWGDSSPHQTQEEIQRSLAARRGRLGSLDQGD